MKTSSRQSLTDFIKNEALAVGFDLVGLAEVGTTSYHEAHQFYQAWLNRGLGADMQFLSRHSAIKEDPHLFLKEARSVVVVAAAYSYPKTTANEHGPLISNYAQSSDYHLVLEERLEGILEKVRNEYGGAHRSFVDRHPVMDRTWAALAGLGWLGKNTCLINRKTGSYIFIGGFFTTLEAVYDSIGTDHCGRCRLCIDACPTQAILEPSKTGLSRHVIDSNKCISYHTIENRNHIPEEVSSKMGEWLIGCDICQQVCPWNNQRTISPSRKSVDVWFGDKNAVASLGYEELRRLDEPAWKAATKNTAAARVKYAQFLRNLQTIESKKRA